MRSFFAAFTIAFVAACAPGADDSADSTTSEVTTASGLRGRATCEVQYASSTGATPTIEAAATDVSFIGAFPRFDATNTIGRQLPYVGRAELVGTNATDGKVTLSIEGPNGVRGNIIVFATLAGLDPSMLNYRNFGQLKVPVAQFDFRGQTYDTVAAHCSVQL